MHCQGTEILASLAAVQPNKLARSDRQAQPRLKDGMPLFSRQRDLLNATAASFGCKQLLVYLNKECLPSYPAKDLQISLPTACIWNTSPALYCNV